MPIIENTARESELTGRLREAIKAYPKTQAVLVRRHGVYVWGSSWIQAKTQSECYDYLFECAIKMKAIGVDAAKPAPQHSISAVRVQSASNGTAANGHAANRHSGKLLTPGCHQPLRSVKSVKAHHEAITQRAAQNGTLPKQSVLEHDALATNAPTKCMSEIMSHSVSQLRCV